MDSPNQNRKATNLGNRFSTLKLIFVVFKGMPFTLYLDLNLEHRPETIGLGLGLHGMIYRQLGKLNPNLSSSLHQERGQPHQPAAFSLYIQQEKQDQVVCAVNILDETLLEPFVQTFTRGVEFGSTQDQLQGEIIDVHLSGLRYEDLIRLALAAPVPNQVELQFLSCTTLRHNNTQLHSPIGLHVWNGLRSRWVTHSPFPEFAFETEYMLAFLEPPDLTRDWLRVPHRTADGFIGWAGYEVLGHPEARRIAGALARFAEFSGVGQYVAFGAGNVRATIF
jgi:CRISPR/Cas system endoribonuclease Cas6 (RAMP superfamily)